jgi:hypothetical protein
MSGRSLQIIARAWLVLLFLDLTVVHFTFPEDMVGELLGCSVGAVVQSPVSVSEPSLMIAHDPVGHGDHVPVPSGPDTDEAHSCFWNGPTLRAADDLSLPLSFEIRRGYPLRSPVHLPERPFRNLFRPPRVS